MKTAANIGLVLWILSCNKINCIENSKLGVSTLNGIKQAGQTFHILPKFSHNKTTYENWSTDRKVKNLWKIVAETPEHVVQITNYAHSEGMRVRASGSMHTWAPLTVLDDTDVPKTILVDTRKNLNQMEISHRIRSSAVVRVQSGVLMDDLCSFLEKHGYAFLATPAPGDITIGGVLAINGHGTAIPAVGEIRQEGHTYGSISNLIVSFTAVVWDSNLGAYTLKTFQRSDAEAKAFLTNLGRTFLTEVELRVGPLFNLRCVSYTNISSTELFADPVTIDENTKTFSSFLDISGRVEAILFPFADKPWLKVWTVSPIKPPSSRKVNSPYNYAFSDSIPREIADIYNKIQSGIENLTPLLGHTQYKVTRDRLVLSDMKDIWGPAKNTLLYILPTTLRQDANGYAVITTRNNIQAVISTVFSQFKLLMEESQRISGYPPNGPLEIRVTGVDRAEDVGIYGAQSPTLSAIRPDPANPQFDVAIWFDILTIPGTPKVNRFLAAFESFLFSVYNENNGKAIIRPEWSKGWAYTDQGGWLNKTFLTITIPQVHQSYSANDGWSWAISVFNKYDPANVFTNNFLSNLMPNPN